MRARTPSTRPQQPTAALPRLVSAILLVLLLVLVPITCTASPAQPHHGSAQLSGHDCCDRSSAQLACCSISPLPQAHTTVTPAFAPHETADLIQTPSSAPQILQPSRTRALRTPPPPRLISLRI